MNKNFRTILEAIMLIIWIITVIFFCIIVFSDGAKCKANPLVYGVNFLEEQNNATFTCSCEFDNEPDFNIIVDKEGWYLKSEAKEELYQLPISDFNFSI